MRQLDLYEHKNQWWAFNPQMTGKNAPKKAALKAASRLISICLELLGTGAAFPDEILNVGLDWP